MQAPIRREQPFRLHIAVIATALCLGLCPALSGCAQSIPTQLPELRRDSTDAMMSKAAQQKEIDDLAKKKAAAEANAVKQIERQR